MISDLTTQVIEFALNGLALRQQVIGNNIANIDTPGFKAGVVLFEDQLRRALAEGDHKAGLDPSTWKPAVIRQEDTSLRTDGNNVDLEREMAMLADTELRYTALARLATARLSLLRAIVTEGRR